MFDVNAEIQAIERAGMSWSWKIDAADVVDVEGFEPGEQEPLIIAFRRPEGRWFVLCHRYQASYRNAESLAAGVASVMAYVDKRRG
jgi:hypothetical protein